MKITLNQLLRSRDERQSYERKLISEYKDKTLLVFTVIVPGEIKRNENSLLVANEGIKYIQKQFKENILYEKLRDLDTGYEAYFIVNLLPKETKRIACEIEEKHPLGRLFDIDVFTSSAEPISRSQIGIEPRKCLLCNNIARICMREKKHSYDELNDKINQLIHDYVRRI